MYFWWFLKCLMFFLWKTYKTKPPCQNFPTGQPAKPGKYYKKNKILTKRSIVASTVPSVTNTSIEAWVSWGVPSDLRSRSEQSQHRPRLCSIVYSLQWAFPSSTLQKRSLNSLFMIVFSDYGKKDVIFYEI